MVLIDAKVPHRLEEDGDGFELMVRPADEVTATSITDRIFDITYPQAVRRHKDLSNRDPVPQRTSVTRPNDLPQYPDPTDQPSVDPQQVVDPAGSTQSQAPVPVQPQWPTPPAVQPQWSAHAATQEPPTRPSTKGLPTSVAPYSSSAPQDKSVGPALVLTFLFGLFYLGAAQACRALRSRAACHCWWFPLVWRGRHRRLVRVRGVGGRPSRSPSQHLRNLVGSTSPLVVDNLTSPKPDRIGLCRDPFP